MGYRRKRTTRTLSYGPGSDYPGLEVEMRPMSVEIWLSFTGMGQTKGVDGLTLGEAMTSLEIFAENLVSWNLEDEDTGEPVPVADALKEDLDFLQFLAGDWLRSFTEVPAPLEQPSDDGPPLGAVPLPMETL